MLILQETDEKYISVTLPPFNFTRQKQKTQKTQAAVAAQRVPWPDLSGPFAAASGVASKDLLLGPQMTMAPWPSGISTSSEVEYRTGFVDCTSLEN